jgi:hypothetical protein
MRNLKVFKKALRNERNKYNKVKRLKNTMPFNFCFRYGGINIAFWRRSFYK